MVTACELKLRFRRCGEPGLAVCQYCGRNFCERHGSRLEDGQEICLSTRCERKRLDLERHFAYKDEVSARNEARSCGHPGCARPPEGPCRKCQGLFCARHLDVREIEEHRALSTVLVRAHVCRHCDRRRALWSKR